MRSRAVPVRLGRLTDDDVRGFCRRSCARRPSADELEQRVAAAEGSIGKALAGGDEAGKAQQAARQLLEAVLAGPGPIAGAGAEADRRGRRGVSLPPCSMLSPKRWARPREEPAGTDARWAVPEGSAPPPRPDSPARSDGARGGREGSGMGKREPAASAGRAGSGAGGGAVKLSHLDERGRPRMVDVGDKPESERTAVAEGAVRMSAEAFEVVAAQAVAKGDVLAVAEVAGTMGAKRTGELIPLCHPLGLDLVQVEARLEPELPGVRVTATAKATGRLGWRWKR